MVRPASRTLARVVVAGALALSGSACGASARGTTGSSPSASPTTHRTIVVPTPAPPPPGIHLSFIQQRFEEGTRRSEVRVTNGGRRPLHVRSVGVDWGGYPLRLHRVDYDVPGQQVVDLRYLLPRAVCSEAAARSPMWGVAVTGSRTIRQPMAADGRRFLTRLWRTECADRRLRRAVTVSYGDDWSVTDTGGHRVLHGRLVLTRRRGELPITVAQVEGSVLFDVRLGGASLLPAGALASSLPLEVRGGGRCDPHSRGQSTTSFSFRVFLRLGDGPPTGLLVIPTPAQQQRLLTFLDHACSGT